MDAQVSREAGRRERLEEMQWNCRNNSCHVVVTLFFYDTLLDAMKTI